MKSILQWSLAPNNWIGGVERWVPNRIKLLFTLFLCKYIYKKIHIKVDIESTGLIFPMTAHNKCGSGAESAPCVPIEFSLCTANTTFLLCCALQRSCPLLRHEAPFSSSTCTENIQHTLWGKKSVSTCWSTGCLLSGKLTIIQLIFFFFFLPAEKDHCVYFMALTKRGDGWNALKIIFVINSAVLLPLFDVKDIFCFHSCL